MKRILIIEDDAVLTSIYQQQYKAAGYDVATATNGETGWQKIQSYKPHLVQIDLLIPKINGVELIKRIRLQPEWKQLPIIVLTSCYHDLTVKQASQAGANQVISKLNTSPRLLLETIERLLTPTTPSAAETQIQSSNEHALGDVRADFMDRIPRFQNDMRTALQKFITARGDTERLTAIEPLYQTVRGLVGHAGMSGFIAPFHVGAALEGLLQDLQAKPNQITASVIRTVANSIDSLNRILKNAAAMETPRCMSSMVLCVDDEPVSQQLISRALQRVNLKCLNLKSPTLALEVLSTNPFDLIFLDVDMPDMDGFALCKQIRALPTNQNTPVIFVTSLAGFDNKARSILSGGNDLIAKPFLMMELALKALTYVVNSRL